MRLPDTLADARTTLSALVTLGASYRRFDCQTGEDESYLARATDSWPIALYRYKPRAAALPFPVVCAHGMAESRVIYDPHPDASLARHLAECGFDTWLVDLRGRNRSWPAGRPDARQQWCFDDFVGLDLPAAIDRTCEISGAAQVFWIGVGMGGQALYAAAIRDLADRVRGAVTLGAPVGTPRDAQIPGVTARPTVRRNGRIPFRRAARTAGPILAYARSRALEPTFRPDNVAPLVAARYLRCGVPDEAERLVEQVADWLARGTMHSRDGAVVYSDRLAEVTLPLLVIGGARDVHSPPAAVRQAFDAFASTDKSYFEAGEASGSSADFGHADLLFGITAAQEIHPRVSQWLRARS